MSAPTAHNSAGEGEFAQTVLMPGDPMRAAYIAQNYLAEARLVNNVRGIQGYTGYWRERPVSVMASGMGIPSIGIYCWELYQVYHVENIIRIGTAGALREDLKLKDIVFGLGASTDSNFMNQFKLPGTFAPLADHTLLRAAEQAAEKLAIKPVIGSILSSDVFYADCADDLDAWRKMGILAVEMEAAGLYATAARCGKRALAICTISNRIGTSDELSSAERERSLDQMIRLALDAAFIMEEMN